MNLKIDAYDEMIINKTTKTTKSNLELVLTLLNHVYD